LTKALNLESDHSGAHPEEFRDIIFKFWQPDLRRDAFNDMVLEDRVDAMLL
jgi:hypothetical protein